MKLNRNYILLSMAAMFIVVINSWADDLIINGTISGTQNYDSAEGIVFEAAVLNSNSDVTASSAFETYLKPGTNVIEGARLVVSIKDPDGLPNRCEMQYFGDLSHEPSVDDDGDQLTNLQECLLGTNPATNNPDNDGDNIPDWWEVQFFGLNLGNDPGQDYDGDGLTNYQEYTLGLNPVEGIVDSDADQLPDWWEVQHFGLDLSHSGNSDEDGDGLTNFDEYKLGLDPNDGVVDSDGDGLPDAWEVNYFRYDLSQNSGDDSDGDGVINHIEYQLDSNPAIIDLPGTGITIEYDDYGRIKTIYRIPNN